MFRDFSKWRVPHFEKSRNTSPGVGREKQPLQLCFAPSKPSRLLFLQERVAGISDSVLRMQNSRNIFFLSLIPLRTSGVNLGFRLFLVAGVIVVKFLFCVKINGQGKGDALHFMPILFSESETDQ
ncbi:MAG: hypothetical protein WCS52_09180 [bacterium]